jgi:putative membrane protein
VIELIRRNKFVQLSGVLALTAAPVWAASDATGVSPTSGWSWPPAIVAALAITAILYIIGTVRMLRRSARPRQHATTIAFFAAGWISLLIALDSPLHEIGEQLFWVHMLQHEILMLVSAPLLVLGRPLIPFLWALPQRWRERAASIGRARSFRSVWDGFASPVSAWLISALGLWVWHLPWLFDKTLQNDWMHAAQHTTFLLTALLFWWPLTNPTSRFGYGAAIIYVFTTALHTSILGALLTFAPRPWYSPYLATAPLWHWTALEDQQLGGLIMWIPAGTLLIAVGLWLLVKWLNQSQLRWQYTQMAELTRISQGGSR